MISISQDSPTKDPTESKLLPYSDLMHYPSAGQDDSFFEAIDLSDQGNEEREYTEQRIQKINLHNITFALHSFDSTKRKK